MTNLNRNNSTSRYIDGLIVQDLMYSILHKAKKIYILFISMRIKCILDQSETTKYTQSNIPAV